MVEYMICDSCGTQAVILPEKGATVISLSKDGEEFLFFDRENISSAERPRCGIPFLFPIFGRLQDGRYTCGENTYAMEIHGFAHTSIWQVEQYSSDTLVCVLETDETTLAQYPFHFRVRLLFRVADGALTIRQYYENTGDKPMPYNFGFHPYFRVEKLENASVETTAGMYFDYASGKPVPFGHGSVTVAVPEGAGEAGAAFMQVKAPTLLHIPKEGRRVAMEYDENYPQLVLWTLAGKPFLCAEPINGTPNGLNTGVYLTLEPGEVKEATLRIRAERI